MWAGCILLLLLWGSCVRVLLWRGVNLSFGFVVFRDVVYIIFWKKFVVGADRKVEVR
jgi:hypothetical protein